MCPRCYYTSTYSPTVNNGQGKYLPAAPTRDAHTSATPPSSWGPRDRSNDHAHRWWVRSIYTDALGATTRRLTPSMRALPHAHRHRLNGHGCLRAACERRAPLATSGQACHSPAHWPTRPDREAGPGPSLALSAGCMARAAVASLAAPATAEPAAAHIDRIVLRVDQAASCRVPGRGPAARDRRQALRRLGRVSRAVGPRGAPVEGAVASALISVRESVGRSESRGQGGACEQVHGARSLEAAGGGKERPLTRLRRCKPASYSSSSCPRRLQEGARSRTLRPAQRDHLGLRSCDARLSICGRDGWKGR